MIETLSDWLRDFVPGAYLGWAAALSLAALMVLTALVTHRIAFGILRKFARASETDADDLVVAHIARPARWSLVAIALVITARLMPEFGSLWHSVASFVLPALVGWMALSIFRAAIRAMEVRADIDVEDNLQARRSRTRLAILSRMGTFVIVFITVALMLLAIPGVRDIGVTLMASAGLAALAVGAAAQPALKALIGGMQMALTEPIRIDDVVIVDGEWGRVEDIRTTFVVVKIWDERRLIVPSYKFLEETFENWTRSGTELLGTVFLHLDPMADVERLRKEFERQVEAHELWDGRVKVAQVTDTTLDALELRLLISAADSSDAFALRCAIREGMLAFIRNEMPEAVAMRRVASAAEVLWEAGEPGLTPGK